MKSPNRTTQSRSAFASALAVVIVLGTGGAVANAESGPSEQSIERGPHEQVWSFGPMTEISLASVPMDVKDEVEVVVQQTNAAGGDLQNTFIELAARSALSDWLSAEASAAVAAPAGTTSAGPENSVSVAAVFENATGLTASVGVRRISSPAFLASESVLFRGDAFVDLAIAVETETFALSLESEWAVASGGEHVSWLMTRLPF